MDSHRRALFQIHVCVVLWGFTAILGKLITLPAIPLVWWRLLLVTAALACFPRVWRALRTIPPRLALVYAGIGCVVALHWLAFYGSVKLANASVAATCMALAPAVTALIEPGITVAKERGFSPLVDLAAANTPWIFDSVVVTSATLKQNRATLTRFVKAYIAGAYLALADEKKAKEVIAQKFKTSDPKVIEATYADFKRLMPRDAAPSIEGAKSVLEQLEAIGTDIGSRNVNDYLDLSIIDQLKQEGYFAQLEKAYPVK